MEIEDLGLTYLHGVEQVLEKLLIHRKKVVSSLDSLKVYGRKLVSDQQIIDILDSCVFNYKKSLPAGEASDKQRSS